MNIPYALEDCKGSQGKLILVRYKNLKYQFMIERLIILLPITGKTLTVSLASLPIKNLNIPWHQSSIMLVKDET